MDCNDDDEARGACLEALVTGTMALMTAWAAQRTDAGTCPQRALIARKIVSNLFFLQQHPQARPALRQVFGHLHRQWVCTAAATQAAQHDRAGERGTLH